MQFYPTMSDGNLLFPVFLRLDKLNVLIVGAGNVGWEKVGIMFRHADNGNVTVVAPEVREEIEELGRRYRNLIIIKKKFEISDLEGKDVVIAATADNELNKFVHQEAKRKGLLVNVADTPDLCDFYLSSVVKKGDLKVAISSNGKSPTLTKRVRELLEDVLPEEIDAVLENLNQIRDSLKGDLEEKIKKLNEITSIIKNENK